MLAHHGAVDDEQTSLTQDVWHHKPMINFKSGLLRHALPISLGLLVLATHAQGDPPPEDIPGTDTFQEFHGSTQSRASVPSSHSRSCNCNGTFYNRFASAPSSYGVPLSVRITSIEVKGDLADASEYIDFRVSSVSSWIRYQGSGDNNTYSYYAYNGAQPSVVYDSSSDGYGFNFDYFVPNTVNYSPSGISPAGAYYSIKLNYTVTYSDPGPIRPPSLNSITPRNGGLTLNITPPNSGPTPDGYRGFCGRSAGQVSQSLMAPVSIAASGITNSSLAPTTEIKRYVVGNVGASVNISHQWRGELELKLYSPSGKSVTLWTGEELDSGTQLSSSFSLPNFDGEYATGNWRLQIEDRVEGDGGTLNNWSLAFNTRKQIFEESYNSSTIEVPVLTNGEIYNCYAVSFIFSFLADDEESLPSNSLSALVGATPGKPTITVEPEDKRALVYVKSIATGGLDITQYEGVCQSSQGTRTSTSTNKTIEVTPLTNGLGYLCKARARNQQGWGPYSDEEKVRPEEQASGLPIWLLYVATNQSGGSGGGGGGTSANVPGTPGTPSATAGNAQVTLTWAAPTNDGGATISGYRIQQAYAGDTTYNTVVSNTGSASTSHNVTGLNNGVSYQYRVAAINAAGAGANSNASSSVTPSANAFVGCDSAFVTCSENDMGAKNKFGTFSVPAHVLAIPFTIEASASYGTMIIDSFDNAGSDFFFHSWWSADPGGQALEVGGECSGVGPYASYSMAWASQTQGSSCVLSTGFGGSPVKYWFNMAYCSSAFDCLPVNGHTYTTASVDVIHQG